MPVAWVYIMTNRANGPLYVGVTSDLVKRVWQHRKGVFEGFSSRHGLNMLVWFEGHDEVVEAIRREKALKNWLRAWKVRLVLEANPGWVDLYPSVL